LRATRTSDGSLQTHNALREVKRLAISVSRLPRDKLVFLRDEAQPWLPTLVGDLMRRKLPRRTRRLKGEMSMKDLAEVKRRA